MWAETYQSQPHTCAGEVTFKAPKLRRQAFETAIIERYQRQETLVEGRCRAPESIPA